MPFPLKEIRRHIIQIEIESEWRKGEQHRRQVEVDRNAKRLFEYECRLRRML